MSAGRPAVGGPHPIPLTTILAAAAVVLYLAVVFHSAVVPFALSFALAYLVNPVINIFVARGFRRDHTVVFFYILIALGISIAANFLLPTVGAELSELQTNAPKYLNQVKGELTRIQDRFAAHLPVGQTLVQNWSMRMYNPLMNHVEKVPSYLLGLLPLLSLLFLVPFITFFMLMDSSKFAEDLIQFIPSRYVEQIVHLMTDIDTSLGNYVRGVLIEASAVGGAAFLGLLLLGVDYALAIGTLAGLANMIPYVGALLGAGVAAAVALVQFGHSWVVVHVLTLFLAIRLADDFLLQPAIARYTVALHPLVYLLALLIGGHAFGFVGLLLGVPVACVVKSLLRVAWYWYATQTRLRLIESPAGISQPYT